MDNLLPCPFCGETERIWDKYGHNAAGNDVAWLRCGACHADGPSVCAVPAKLFMEAMDAWNKRAAETQEAGQK